MNKLMKACAGVLTVALAGVSVCTAADMPSGESSLASLEIRDVADLTAISIPGQEKTVTAEAELFKAAGESAEQGTAYAMAVNGEDILYVATKEDAEAVLAGIVSSYATPGAEITEVTYAEEVSYEKKEIVTAEDAEKDKSLSETYICEVEEAVQYILNGTSVPLTYTVQGGDTLWDIALANGLSVYELRQMNPGSEKRLAIGQTLNLYQKNPFVHVTITEIATETQNIPYDVAYTESDSLYRGQVQVQSAGQNGTKEVKTQVTKTNGIVTASTVLEEKVLTTPVTQIALTGTKQIAVQSGSGFLQYPVASVEISSGYGASRSGGRRSHKGIDLRAPKGTAFMAADSGTVTFAGWGGGSYGYLITINHGGGVVTKYAHCNSISVSVGQNVQKGEVIGTIGSTGNATGNVLHFEVLINGVQKNPVSYL